MNYTFSKVLIFIIVVVFVGGGIFAWQYFRVPQEETKLSEELINETADWKTDTTEWEAYEGPFPIHFSYPKNLKLAQGNTDYGVSIGLKSPLRDDKDSDFSFRILFPFYGSSSTKLIQYLKLNNFTEEKEFYIDGFLAMQLEGTSTPNAFIASRK
ncbi:hypothetical protein IIA94_02090, partial [Patescibacteria group bacterium]|nr:hypothetical protein [Patescibacteria group bacterium]